MQENPQQSEVCNIKDNKSTNNSIRADFSRQFKQNSVTPYSQPDIHVTYFQQENLDIKSPLEHLYEL